MATPNFNFIQDPKVLATIQVISDLVGNDFNFPYDSSQQPIDAVAKNAQALLQFQLPGATTLRGYADPSLAESMGSAINSLMAGLAPIMSVYGFLLPILGVIRGIIEVLCAMMNPFAVIRAIIRLFKKWIPPFIALFPPLAGLIIILGIIKLILAITFYIMTVVVPTYQLIKHNIKVLEKSFGPNANDQTRAAGKAKLEKLLEEFLNQIGVLAMLKPLLEIITLILGFKAGFPCGKGKKGHITVSSDDTTCCGDLVCPPELKRGAITGRGTLIPASFGNAAPFFAFKLFTNHSLTPKLKKYNQSLRDQLNQQLDEEVDEACAPGGDDSECPTLRVRIKSRRGRSNEILKAIAKISGSTLTVISPSLATMTGAVDFEIEPNYDVLIMRNMIGLGCHPDIEDAKAALEARTPALDLSIAEKFPEVSDISGDYNKFGDDINKCFSQLKLKVANIIVSDPPYNTDDIDASQDCMLNVLNNFADDMKNKLRSLISKGTDKDNSDFSVDKNIVRADGKDKAIISVIPRDITGANLTINLPADVDVQVELFTDLGIITNQHLDNTTGQISADITSPIAGVASLTAKINSDFISDFDGISETVRVIKVRFVSDAVLPQRRVISTPAIGIKAQTGLGSERETRSK